MGTRRKTFPHSIGFVLTLAFLVLFVFGFYYFVGVTIRGFASNSWSQTQGVVVSTSIQRTSRVRGGICFNAVITYEYNIKGQTYGSNFYDPRLETKCFRKRPDAAEFVARFGVGSRMPVYYDPKQPSLAVMKPGLRPITHVFFGLMAAIFLLLIVVFGYGVWTTLNKLLGSGRR
jgi:hypothetical protein